MDIKTNSGCVVLNGKTCVEDPYENFCHAFSGSSTSGSDVSIPNYFVICSADVPLVRNGDVQRTLLLFGMAKRELRLK